MSELIQTGLLVRDFTIYPRDKVVNQNITDMVRALKAGKQLPPLIVDRESLRIIDGFHRFEAHTKFHGPDVEIEVQFEEHDDASLFVRAMETNVSHGVKLSQFDKIKCVQKGESLGITRDDIADALSMTRKTLDGTVERKTAIDGEVIKRTVGHFAGKPMNPKQKAYNLRAGGMDQKYYIDQVTSLLESDSINWANENVVESLEHLRQALEEKMALST